MPRTSMWRETMTTMTPSTSARIIVRSPSRRGCRHVARSARSMARRQQGAQGSHGVVRVRRLGRGHLFVRHLFGCFGWEGEVQDRLDLALVALAKLHHRGELQTVEHEFQREGLQSVAHKRVF